MRTLLNRIIHEAALEETALEGFDELTDSEESFASEELEAVVELSDNEVLNQLHTKLIREAPFRWICSVTVNHGKPVLPVPAHTLNADPRKDLMGPSVGGSGLLISSSHVLTCGHIFADRLNANHKPKEVIVSFGTTNQSTLNKEPILGPWFAESFWFHPRVMAPNPWESRSFDFGLIKLQAKNFDRPGDMMIDMKNKGRERFGWWGQSRPNYFMNTHRAVDWLRSRKVNVYGFPQFSDRKERKLHHGFGAVSAVCERDKSKMRLHPTISYDVRTRGGMSGGPVWIREKDSLERRLVGIHGGNWNSAGHGSCLLMNHVIAAFLREHGVKNGMLEAADKPY